MGRLRTLAAIGGVAAIAVTSTVLGAAPAGAAAGLTSDEGVFLASINQARAARGLAPLAVDDRLTQLGRWWSGRMAAAGDISHNPSLDAMVPSGWSAIGENVAMAPTAAGAATALLNSPPHFENMVNPDFTAIGIGVARSAGMLYVTEEFYDGTGGPTAPLPASPAAARPSTTLLPAKPAAPRVTTTTTAPATPPTVRATPAVKRTTATTVAKRTPAKRSRRVVQRRRHRQVRRSLAARR